MVTAFKQSSLNDSNTKLLELEEKLEKEIQEEEGKRVEIEVYKREEKKKKTEFKYEKLSQEIAKKLQEYKLSIYRIAARNIETVVEIGKTFNKAKELIPRGIYVDWVRSEFEETIGLSYEKINRYIVISRAWEENPEYREALRSMNLGVIYSLFNSSMHKNVLDYVIDLIKEGEEVNKTDIPKIKEEVVYNYKKIVLNDSRIDNKAKTILIDTKIAEDKKEVALIEKLSKSKQIAASYLIAEGKAKNVKQAIKQLSSYKSNPIISYDDILKNKEKEPSITKYYNSLNDIPYESVDLIVAECPLRYSYMTDSNGFQYLSSISSKILKPGGFFIATIGHKSILESANYLSELVGLHALCIRRQPGYSRGIVGINITSASILAVIAYKRPFRKPKTMLVDLQTIDSDNLIIPETDIIESGIEKCFERFIVALIESDHTLAHFIMSKNPSEQFGIRPYIETLAVKLQLPSFIIN